jgi:two-component system, cell cycle response regulator DivK
MDTLQGKRIFYIEDDSNNRNVVTMILEQNGAKVAFERLGGEDAIKRMKAFLPVDFILCDLMLPQNNTGYDLYDTIRAIPEFVSTPIIAISSADATMALPKVQAKGFDGFISKPINVRDFPRQLLQILNHERAWHAK